eukprot:CAMPEP_0119527896 /NCGR_PEP_ID=MMETSP1344-20130328/42203_1 /TAXON_ID=236787 /ORGANISM="Florenciella parvula, Strain CCMP2471" /LENGTH=46 /DNA_ID= /DNA_START= /DNA_END= /DNA_ORIENTATION=
MMQTDTDVLGGDGGRKALAKFRAVFASTAGFEPPAELKPTTVVEEA